MPKATHRFRSARTGRFVKAASAKRRPATTVREAVKPARRKK